jgi:hypothetical protein
MNNYAWINLRRAQAQKLTTRIGKWNSHELSTLQWRPHPEAWNILECVQHLNLYSAWYLPVVRQKLDKAPAIGMTRFKEGWLGRYFAQSMLPKVKGGKMKTFKDKNPLGQILDKTVFDTFAQYQRAWLELLSEAEHKDLNRIKIPTSISSLITMNLGDTFHFIFNHMERHALQMEQIAEQFRESRS